MSLKTFYTETLGCAKNLVDSDSMAQLLASAGYLQVDDPSDADILIVNTCGFIDIARRESLQALKKLAAHKHKKQKLIAAGCLTQRYGDEITRQISGIDGVIGTRRWMDIVTLVDQLRTASHNLPLYHLPNAPTMGREPKGIKQFAVQGASAYLKIADGCRNPCAFCAIPLIKGRTVSRPLEVILEEARSLQEKGIHELNLIAQDTTDYGYDLGLKDGLAVLLERLLVAVPEIEWIRILYTYPGHLTDRLMELMGASQQIVPYLDMPLQHAHPETLRRMRRPSDIGRVSRMLERFLKAVPGLALRTTFIVGYPGETEDEFRTLLDFVKDIRFDHLGAFQFSFEPGTASEKLGDPVPAEVKQERYQRLMEQQQRISLEKNRTFVGKVLDVLVEGHGEGISLGRSYRDAPETDGMVIIDKELPIGKLAPIYITGALAYDLIGTLPDGATLE